MAEAPHEQQGVELSGFGANVKLFGGNSLFVFLLLLMAANIGVTIWAGTLRSKEHDEIQCSTKLAIFVYSSTRNTTTGTVDIQWDRLPVDLFGCLPTFLYKTPHER
jgi:hypothetical protein